MGFKLVENLVLILGNLAKNAVLSIEMWGGTEAEEELGSVGVWSSVGHGEEEWLGVLQGEVLVSELVSVDGLATGSVSDGEVTSLGHEAVDDSVEDASLEVEWLA